MGVITMVWLAQGAFADVPLGTAFTYQGRLNDDGAPAQGTYDFQFILYDAAVGGNQEGPIIGPVGVAVSDGLFTADLDFGVSAFDGSARWLDIAVDGVPLVPRRPLTPAPYALQTRGIFVSDAGRVGMGTADPAFGKLQVEGSDYGVYSRSSSTTNGAGIYGNGRYGVFGVPNDPSGFGGVFSGSGAFGTGNALWVTGIARIADSLTVGGSSLSATPAAKLHVENGSDTSPAGGGFAILGATSGANISIDNNEIMARNNGAAATLTLNNDGGNVHMVPLGTGNVGIGNPTPLAKLDVKTDTASAGNNTAKFHAPSLGPNTSHIHYGTKGNWYIRSADSTGNIIVQDTGGNVGIGTTTPTEAKVEIDGADGSAILCESTPTAYTPTASFHNRGNGLAAKFTSDDDQVIFAEGNHPSFAAAVFINYGDGGAGTFQGDVSIYGQLSKSSGSFRIDHPLDPANKYLYHSFVESPDMKNLYDGVVVTDDSGYATITMPEWFETLNRDFRYQLTVIDGTDGDEFVLAKVVHEIADRTFTVRTSRGGVKVSWQVTGTRQDPWAEAHRIPIEEDKSAHERGKYQHPELYGQPRELGISHRPPQADEQTHHPVEE